MVGQRELDLIDDVCRGVIATWSITASATDRALLLDLSTRLDRYDVEDHLRFLLRDHFWEKVGTSTADRLEAAGRAGGDWWVSA